MIRPRLFANRNFRLLFAASAFTNLGDGCLAVALPWFATRLTSDPLLIGAAAAARQLPWLILSLPAGVITDRFDRRKLILTCDALRLVLAAALVLLAMAPMAGAGAIWALTALTFALGAAEVLRDNTAQSFLPAVVPKDRLEDANGLLWSAEQVAGQFAGPPLAGLLIGIALALPFGVEAAMLATAIGLVLRMDLPPTPRAAPQPFGPALKEGLLFLWRHQTLRRMALALGAFNFIGSMFWALVVLYAQTVLGLSAAGYGVMLAVVAGGGLMGSLFGPAILRRTGPTAGLLAGLGGFGVAAALMASTQNVVAAGAALTLEAFTALLWNIATVSYRQRHIPAQLLGRVNAAYRFCGTGPSAFGAVAGGLVVTMGAPLGPVAALQLPYAICLGGAALILVFVALFLRLD